MPELPEVETTRLGLTPFALGVRINRLIIRTLQMRYPVPQQLMQLQGERIHNLRRRGKYLILDCDTGSLLFHLGMSGSLAVVENTKPPQCHDHVDIVLANGYLLRFTDPRRFGAVLWQPAHSLHPLLRHLGPEPFSKHFTASYLYGLAQKRRLAVKSFIMDSKVVVGVGNIYATEGLFCAGIHPRRAVCRISKIRYARLVDEVCRILRQAIQNGGTTLKDFVGGDGKPGYFAQNLKVYGRAGKTCVLCKTPLRSIQISQRASVYCPHCQT